MCPNPEVVLELAADADSTRNSRLLIQLEGGTAFPGLPLPAHQRLHWPCWRSR